ncbi:MAG: acyltransferase [Marmoricola sp.]|nr:acyltransferase [Marmoricola sp.]
MSNLLDGAAAPRATAVTPVPAAGSYPVLDTMRAVGALLVVVTHCAFSSGDYTRLGWLGPLMARSNVGVALFFVLSGFLLSRPWLLSARAGTPPPSLRRYAVHRVLRILPAYVVVALASLLLLPSNDGLGPLRWLTTFTLTDIYFFDRLPYGLTQTWSLVTEVAFYVLLPLLALATTRARRSGQHRRPSSGRAVTVLAGMSATTVLWLLVLSARVPGHPARVDQWLPAYLLWFAAGIALALVAVSPPGSRAHRALRVLASSPGSCWLAAAGLLLVSTTPLAGPTLLVPATATEALTQNLLYVLVAVLVITPGIFGAPTTGYARAMSHPALRHLGLISYSLFLVHMPVLQLVQWLTGYPLFGGHLPAILGLTLLISLPLAELLHRLVEVPALRLRRHFDGSAARTSAAATATTTR